MSHNDNIKIKFSGNDFFYVNVANNAANSDYHVPNDSECNTLIRNASINDTYCTIDNTTNSNWLKDNSGNCYKKEICQNKKKAIELNNLENNHSGRDQNFINSQNIYSLELRRSIALSLGLIILFGSIIYSKK